jgi:hypothetical protein
MGGRGEGGWLGEEEGEGGVGGVREEEEEEEEEEDEPMTIYIVMLRCVLVVLPCSQGLGWGGMGWGGWGGVGSRRPTKHGVCVCVGAGAPHQPAQD